ncbi:ABC transporter substrate-binding protein [Sphingobium sufflavum]|uniref:ABC transporter substrate-binding protein n=1 Tax=Sphingobium sufflavum TaxID=1129547 RepID=UPI002277B280|nr:ABC transporter substrate-binding protein [Sphingobium sufflavum]
MSQFRIGFLPLVDAVLPIVAHEMGLAAREGVHLTLIKDRTWATVRDRLAYGQTDAAHLVAPVAIAMALGLDRAPVPIGAPFMLGLNGNAIAVSNVLAEELGIGMEADVRTVGERLTAVAKAQLSMGRRLRIAVVHRYSSHNYMLRYWLAACGCDPDFDVEIVVVAPPLIADAFAAGEIDASVVGEPWNSLAVERGDGVIISSTSRIWTRGVEKLLAFRSELLEDRRPDVEALLRALYAAGQVVLDPGHTDMVARLLAREEYIGLPQAVIARAITGRMICQRGGEPTRVEDFLVLHGEAANFPWRSQAMWLYSQMVRWGHAKPTEEGFAAAAAVFRPDVYRSAFAGTGAVLPGASLKVEGAISAPLGAGSHGGRLVMGPDAFFDGRLFDPDDPFGYLASDR